MKAKRRPAAGTRRAANAAPREPQHATAPPGRRAAAQAQRRRREQRPQRVARPQTSPITAAQLDGPARPKNASQAKARAKARKAKAPKVVRPPLRERLIARAGLDRPEPAHPRRQGAVRGAGHRVARAWALASRCGCRPTPPSGPTSWATRRETNQALLQQKEALEREVLEAQAAPALAEAARNLGMIPSRDTAHLVQDPAGNWVVVGTPKPAEGVAAATAEHAAARGGPAAAPPGRAPRVVRAARGHRPHAAAVPAGARLRCRRSSRRRLARRQRRWPSPPGADGPARRHRTAARAGPAPVAPAAPPAAAPAAPVARPRTRPLRRSTPVRRRRPRPWPRRRPGAPHEPRRRSRPTARRKPKAAQGATPARSARRGHGGRASRGRKRFAQCVIRVPAPGGQRRHLPGAAGRRRAAVQPAGARAPRACAPRRRVSSRSPTSRRPCAAASSTATTTSWRSPSRPAR